LVPARERTKAGPVESSSALECVMNVKKPVLAAVCSTFILAGVDVALAQDSQADDAMSFFITSEGPGDGANLGGLEGADRHCQSLAAAAGAGEKTWKAYLSTSGSGDAETVNARDRIGHGPWYNAKGVLVAE